MRQIKITPRITNRESASLEKYFREISREPLISPEEEVALADRIKKGDKEAVNQLTKANLRFVISVAKQYQGMGLSLSDLVNEGNLGLIKATELFDASRGMKFITYAVWWIRQNIKSAINEKGRMIRLPLSQIAALQKINTFYNDFVQKNERRPTLSEISDGLEMDIEKVTDTLICARRHVSVDIPVGDNEEGSMVDLIEDKSEKTPDIALLNESLSAEVDNALHFLPPRERKILRMYFGIGETEKTLYEIGKACGIETEKVKQLKDKAIRTLRNRNKNKHLRSFLGQ